MKTIFTLIASFFLSVAAMAAGKPDARSESKLTVSMDGYGEIRVELDGKGFNSADQFLVIRDVRPGYHEVVIYKERDYPLRAFLGRKYDIVYNGSLNVRPGTNVMVNVDRMGRAAFDEKRISYKKRGNDWYDDDDDRFNHDRGHHYGRDDDRFDHDRGHHNGRNDRNDRGYDDDRSFGNNNYARPMYAPEFGRVKDMMSREIFETARMTSARQIISTNYFTTDQVCQLVCLFQFESNRLELAKMAYAKTVDPRNYDLVMNHFTFNSSRAALSDYISRFRY